MLSGKFRLSELRGGKFNFREKRGQRNDTTYYARKKELLLDTHEILTEQHEFRLVSDNTWRRLGANFSFEIEHET